MLNTTTTRVLVVDDDARQCELLAEMVSSLGFHAVRAADGKEALEIHAENPVDIILTDLMLPDQPGFDLIAVDNGPSAGAVARHLDDQGYRDCLVIVSRLSITNVRERWQGAQAAARNMRLEVLEIGIDDADGLACVHKRLSSTPRPQAIFCLDHGTALLVYRMLDEAGIAVPGDMAFASFDEMEWMQLVSPGITAVRQPVEVMAEQSWSLLSRRLRGDVSEPVTRRLHCAVEIRGSTPRCLDPQHRGTGQTQMGGVT